MKILRYFGVAALATALSFNVYAADPQPMTAADSINSAAADFVTANLQQGINMVLEQVRTLGLDVDSALLVEQVAVRLREPYDQARHRAAAQYLNDASKRVLQARADRFLSEARARQGAQVLEGGLILEVLQPGEGPNVMPDDTVVFNYTGKLPDGTVFDSTEGQQPLSAKASNLVPGMTNGLTHMNKGGRYRLTIPSELAYGSRGAGDVIPPDTPIEFNIEIVEINK